MPTDTCIVSEGTVDPRGYGVRGWTVLLSDGARFTAVAPHNENERWSVTLAIPIGTDPEQGYHTHVGHRRTLPAAVDAACQSSGTGHVLASLTTHLV